MKTLDRVVLESAVFAGLDNAYAEQLTGCLQTVGFEAGETLFREGEPADVFYVLRRGRVALELYVPGPVEVSIASRTYGVAQPGIGPASVAVAPVSAVVAPPSTPRTFDGWTAAPVLTVALDLAQDRARGREILEAWETDGAVWR